MRISKFFHRSKKEEEKKVEAAREPRKPSELELFCEGDRKLYNVLAPVILSNIRSFQPKEYSIEETLKKAQEMEEAARAETEEAPKSDLLHNAGQGWHFAGQITLFHGDIESTKKFFSKAEKLTGKHYLILSLPGPEQENALTNAQNFYQGKPRQKKEEEAKEGQVCPDQATMMGPRNRSHVFLLFLLKFFLFSFFLLK